MSIPALLAPLSSALTDVERWHGHGPGAWWPIFPLLWFLLVAALITTFAVNGRRRARFGGIRAGEARLAERFAEGDITEQEYRERLAVLKALAQ